MKQSLSLLLVLLLLTPLVAFAAEPITLNKGFYQVGKDIPAGIYDITLAAKNAIAPTVYLYHNERDNKYYKRYELDTMRGYYDAELIEGQFIKVDAAMHFTLVEPEPTAEPTQYSVFNPVGTWIGSVDDSNISAMLSFNDDGTGIAIYVQNNGKNSTFQTYNLTWKLYIYINRFTFNIEEVNFINDANIVNDELVFSNCIFKRLKY